MLLHRFRRRRRAEGNPADLPYARRVAKHLNVDLEEIRIEATAIDRLEEMVALLDEPQADPAPINALFIAERARSMGIPVLCRGPAAMTFQRLSAAPRAAIRALVELAAARCARRDSSGGDGSGQGRGKRQQVRGRRLTKMFAHAGEDAERRLICYFWWSPDELRRNLYSADFAAQIAEADVGEPLHASLAEIPAERDPLQRMLFLETRHFLADHNLNYTDRAGMSAGVEVRVPLLDMDLIDFAARIPPAMKQSGSEGKSIFKEAMQGILPHDVIYRPKSGSARRCVLGRATTTCASGGYTRCAICGGAAFSIRARSAR